MEEDYIEGFDGAQQKDPKVKYASSFIVEVGSDDMFRASPSLHQFQDIEGVPGALLEVADSTTLNRVVAQWREYCGGPTYFRGQRKLYDQYPYSGAYRNVNHQETEVPVILSRLIQISTGDSGSWSQLDYMLASNEPVRDLSNGYKNVPEYALEGLFQHYEGSTRWLDVVDNLQIALWMATRDYIRAADSSSPPVSLVGELEAENEPQSDVYVYLFGFSNLRDVFPGLRATPRNSFLLDLREALPARFLRPHAQHSALIKHDPSLTGDRGEDKSLLYAILKVPYDVALSCCGGALLTVSAIFPSVDDDRGFAQLDGLIRSRLLAAAQEFRLQQDQMLTHYIDIDSVQGRSLRNSWGQSEKPLENG